MIKTIKQCTILLIIAVCINGCSSKGSVIPPSDVEISDVYRNHSSANSNQSLRLAVNEQLAPRNMDVDAYTLHNIQRPDYQFLPNPTLYMYVNHKLSKIDRSPIPSFITEFKLYEKDEYALPSEININWGSR